MVKRKYSEFKNCPQRHSIGRSKLRVDQKFILIKIREKLSEQSKQLNWKLVYQIYNACEPTGKKLT